MEPLATAHDHHRTPRAFGGTDDEGNRVWLCASCHTRLHRVQEFLVQGKASSAYDLTSSIFPSKAKARSNLWELANEAAEAEKETGGAFGLHRDVVQVTISVDKEVWSRVKVIAKEGKMTAKALAAEMIKRSLK